MKVFVFDTETTGFDEPEIIEAAWIGMPDELQDAGSHDGERFEQRYKPTKPVSFGAMATHHIVNSALEDCPPTREFRLPIDLEYMIGHQVDYDWSAAGSPEDVKRICTLAMSKVLWPDADSHKLVALSYMLFGEHIRDMAMHAHEAMTDVMFTKNLLVKILDLKPEIKTWEQLWMFQEECRVPKHLWFGKYGKKEFPPHGIEISRIRRHDPGYHSWLLSGKCDQVNEDPYLRQALER